MKNNPCLKEYSKYVLSNVLAMIGLSCYILADTFFISKGMGTNGLAALNIALPVFNLIFGIGQLLGVGGSTQFSIKQGEGKLNEANKAFTYTVISAGILSAIFIILGLTAAKPISYLLGANEETIELCTTYAQIIMCFAPFFMFNAIMLGFVRNDGAPRLTMIAMISGNLFNILFDYVLVFPCGLGMLGAALATAFSPIVSIIIVSIFILRKKNTFHFVKDKFDKHIYGRIVATGIPVLITEFSTAVVVIIFNKLIFGLAGNTGVAAYSIIVNTFFVVIAIFNGIALGVQPLLSRSYGEGNKQNIAKFLRYAIITVVAISIAMYLFLFFGADLVTSVFNSAGNAELQDLAPLGLRLYFVSMFFLGFNVLLSNYFAATDHAFPAQVITICRGLVVIIPLLYLFSTLWQITGLWLATPIAELIVLILSFSIFIYHKRKERLSMDLHR